MIFGKNSAKIRLNSALYNSILLLIYITFNHKFRSIKSAKIRLHYYYTIK